jgi:putative beta-lysine N-acetyltransferase
MATITKLQYGFYERVEQEDYTTELYVDLHNARIKLLKYKGEVKKLIKNTFDLSGKYEVGKILATVPAADRQTFLDAGFIQEAVIDGYFKGQTGYNVSYFYDTARAISQRNSEEDDIIQKAKEYQGQYEPYPNSEFTIRTAVLADAEPMAQLYETVFKTYPTPMHKVEYIESVINDDKVIFKVALFNHQLVSAASAELNHEYLNAEITDCATYPDYRGKGLLSELVYHLETELQNKRYLTLFGVARAASPGINIVFSKHGYEYTGRQINNSNIMGTMEDMNIWVKKL